LRASGYDRPFAAMQALSPHDGIVMVDRPAFATGQVALAAAGEIVLGPKRQITLPAGLGLDLGGIAKGWVVQQAAHRLGMWGPCLVDAGGDIACVGAPPAGPWVVTLADPLAAERDLAVLSLKNEAVATSTRTFRQWMTGGQPAHHLIDPRTDRPAVTGVVSATVIAQALPDAEIHAKTALILGEVDGLAYLDTIPHLSAILVTEDGRQLQSGLLEERTYVPFDTFPSRTRA